MCLDPGDLISSLTTRRVAPLEIRVKRLWFIAIWLLLVSGSVLAADGPKDVDAAIKQGNYTLAEQELRQAIVDHPQSAKAHYLLAQVLAHEGNVGDAQKEASQAQQLDPKLSFTNPARFEHFQAELNQALAPAGNRATISPRQELAPAAAPVESRSQGSIWPWIFGGVIVVLLFGWFRRRQQGQMVNPGYGAPGAPNAYGNGGAYPPNYPQSPPMGSGIGGSLLGGLAGGVLGAAAVEAYENHERREEGERGFDQSGNAPAQNSQDQAYDNLRNGPIDTGNNSDSWDNGGDSFDGGGDDSWN